MSSGMSHVTIASAGRKAYAPVSTSVTLYPLSVCSTCTQKVRTNAEVLLTTAASIKEGHSETGVLTILSTDSIMSRSYSQRVTMSITCGCKSGRITVMGSRSAENTVTTNDLPSSRVARYFHPLSIVLSFPYALRLS